VRGILRRLAGRLFGIRSPTGKGTAERWADLGASMIEGMKTGMEQAEARQAELLASGMTPEEVRAVMYREMVEDPGFKEMLEYSRGVVMRSFGTLYEGEDAEGGSG
jgi:hypothetical protein